MAVLIKIKEFLKTCILDVANYFLGVVWEKFFFSYKLQPSLLKQKFELDENYEDSWEDKQDEWLPYVKNDLLSTAFCYDRYANGMEEIT